MESMLFSCDVLEIREEGSKRSSERGPYYAYTKKFDETIRAEDLYRNAKLGLHTLNADNDSTYQPVIQRITQRIVRRGRSPSVSVTILIDNSGSLRGRKINALASCARLLMDCLDSWEIRTEVLGFTTTTWAGGLSKQLWLEDGKPPNPGRLSDLRHIIYKSFDERATRVDRWLAIMPDGALLRENIDGEALLWAYSRLIAEQSRTKLIFMFSDGLAKDESTERVNVPGFLNLHLHSVIGRISTADEVELKLVGVQLPAAKLMAEKNFVAVMGDRFAEPVFDAIVRLTN
jgi:cobalamin biosynthesis protein CobT